MRVPLAWLRDYVDLPDAAMVEATLAGLGFPVEAVETRPHVAGVVVGRIDALDKHPNADRLSVCTVDVGAGRPLTIATAATNVAAGQIVPVATIGARLPQLTIEPRMMRGIASEGMLCSPDELALPAEWFEDGIMQLDAQMEPGADVVERFGLEQPVFDVEVTANRPDALCMVGLARELSAALGTALRFPVTATAVEGDSSDVRVTLESLDVRRYVAQRVSGLQVRPAAAWMRVRLALAGQRPIDNLVDISNFVMLELGQPLHFFDVERVAGKHLIVRDARPGETLTTLDGVQRRLDATALLIADDERAIGLAGVMGGATSEVSATTREIVIESANFSGPRVRRMSVKLGLRTEASTRNEKQLPPGLTDVAAARAAHLLGAEGGRVHAPHAYGTSPGPPLQLDLPRSEPSRLLGFEVTDAELENALRSLGFTVEALLPAVLARRIGVDAAALSGVASYAVTVPYWRSDIAIAADLVEEIARVVGYDRVRAIIPPVVEQPLRSDAFERDMAIAHTLVGLGYLECMTLALQPASVAERWRAAGIAVPPVVEIRNPLSDDQRWMRFSLLPALLAHAARERAVRPLRTFEIGHVFSDAPEQPREENVVMSLAVTKRPPDCPEWRDEAFSSAKSDVLALVRAVTGIDARVERDTVAGLHPGKTARILAGDVHVGMVGSVDPRLLQAHDIGDDAVASLLFVDALPSRAVRRHVALSKYPALERDLALVVAPETAAADIVATIATGALVRAVDVFDEYRGPQIGAERKSLAVRVTLQRDDATLTDADADAAISALVAALRERHGAALRG